MSRTTFALCLSVLLVSVVKGQDPIAPYITDSTAVIVESDVTKLKSGLFDHLKKMELDVPVEKIVQDCDTLRKQFLDAGGRRVYVLVSAAHPPQKAVLIVIPLDRQADADALSQLVTKLGNLAVERKQDMLLAGDKEALRDLADRKPAERPELRQGLAAVEKFSQRLVVAIPEAAGRAAEELHATLPPGLGGGSIKSVTRGLRWFAAGLDASDRPSLRILVQARDADSAKVLATLADRGLAALGKGFDPEGKIAAALRPEVEGDRLRVALTGAALADVEQSLSPLIQLRHNEANKQMSINDLKQIGLAFHNAHDVNRAFPGQYSCDAQKKPLLSWRVHLLPYLEQNALYQQFKLDEPWDSEHNKKLIAQIPAIYRSPLGSKVAEGKTTFLVPTGKDLLFGGCKGTRISNITDGTSNTILAIDADDSQAVFWTQPKDLEVDAKNPKAGAVRPGIGILALFADGSVRILRANLADETFHAMLTPRGGEVIPND